MNTHKNLIMERILNLTLEIIYLLTGEDYIILKKPEERVTHSSSPCMSEGSGNERDNEQTMPNITSKIAHVLSGEVPIRCEDIAVYFSTEEWEYLEEHQDLYKDIMMENHLPLNSKDRSFSPKIPNTLCSPISSAKCFRKIRKNRNDTETKEQRIHKPLKRQTDYFPDVGKGSDSCPAQYTFTNTNRTTSCQEENLPNVDIHAVTEHTQSKCTFPSIKGKHVLWETRSLADLLDFTPAGHTSTLSKDKPASQEKVRITDIDIYTPRECIQPEYTATYIKKEHDILGKGNLTDVDIYPQNKHKHKHKEYTSTLKDGFVSCDKETNAHVDNNTSTDQIQTEYTNVVELALCEEEYMTDSDMCTQRNAQRQYRSTYTNSFSYSEGNSTNICTSTEYKSTDIKEGSTSSCEKGNLIGTDIYSSAEYPSIHIKKDLAFSEDVNHTVVNIHCEHTQIQNTSHTGEKISLFKGINTTDIYTPTESSESHHSIDSKVGLVQNSARQGTFEKCFPSSQKLHAVADNLCHVENLSVQNEDRNSLYCPECGKSFTSKSALVRHLKIHSGDTTLRCPDCRRCFRSNSDLLKHQRIHTVAKNCSCSVCGKCYTTNSHLVRHQRIHTGERPYFCSDCGKSFAHNSDFYRHQKTHSAEKPYSCSECGKCFAIKSYLVAHIKTHT
ncbi:gastrula zinc finger protein XlCGF66.1-like [Pelobates fuscus]|uniref:gastrula zinc finger protein XlCGF66.1-like n=1 Tax=Pelobates fuscus TaxID=191477 RepID=UPI002FE4ECED